MIIREDEPTSIIAFTLASKSHRDQVRPPGQTMRLARTQDQASSEEKGDQANSSWDFVIMEEVVQHKEAAARREAGLHLKYGWSIRAFIRLPDRC